MGEGFHQEEEGWGFGVLVVCFVVLALLALVLPQEEPVEGEHVLADAPLLSSRAPTPHHRGEA